MKRQLKRLESEAKRGNAEAQYSLAAILAAGDGVEVDLGRAAYWYERASKQKHPEALYNLGFMYLLGEGVSKDATQAVWLIETAADLGSCDAQELIGDILLNGRFRIRRDPKKAAYYLFKSIMAGNSRAALSLSVELTEKRRLNRRTVSAALLRLAAEGGVLEAQERLKQRKSSGSSSRTRKYADTSRP